MTRCYARLLTELNIQQDALEYRFGWYRQLGGGNYHNSVLQFLQAEKTVRIRSLGQMGFKLSEFKEIFDEVVTEQDESELVFEVDHMIDAMSNFRLEEDLNLDPEDNSIICYVDGSISRSLLKKIPNSQEDRCKSLITRGALISLADGDINNSTIRDEKYLSLVSGGGLQYSSDGIFVTCCPCLSFSLLVAQAFYKRLKSDYLLMVAQIHERCL